MSGRKYFQIGLKKCGTTSIAAFFNRVGVPAAHYDHGRLGRRMQRNLCEGVPLIIGYEGFDVFTNMEYVSRSDWFEGWRHCERLLDECPDASFILNTRHKENWLRSMVALGESKPRIMKAHYQSRYGTKDIAKIVTIWSREWDKHHREVVERIPTERLLVFDVEADQPELLCEFAGLASGAARHFTVENPTMRGFSRALAGIIPLPVKRALPHSLRMRVKKSLASRR